MIARSIEESRIGLVLPVFFVIDFAARKARCQAKLWHASMVWKGE
jgi:hypothetical protein